MFIPYDFKHITHAVVITTLYKCMGYVIIPKQMRAGIMRVGCISMQLRIRAQAVIGLTFKYAKPLLSA